LLRDHIITALAETGFDERLVLAAAGAERKLGLFRAGGEFRDDKELGGEVAVVEQGEKWRVTPLFPASGLVTGSLNGLSPKSKFLAISSSQS
jgi:hypothetical protein